jgi:pilus assembly protein CpaB
MGSLSLSLRSLADNSAELERAVASGEVKMSNSANPADERRMLLAVANRPIDSNTTFTTGGDVSRFQRRSVPAKAKDKSAQVNEAMANFGKGLGQAIGGTGTNAPAAPTGPVVRISRGNNVTVVPVGAR